MFDFLRFADDFNILYITEGKNCASGWIQLCCPFCPDDGTHLGFNIEKGYFHC